MEIKSARKLVVAVHGMGDMKRGDFAQALSRLFARHYREKTFKASPQAERLPAGAWSSEWDRPATPSVPPLIPTGPAGTRTVAVQFLPPLGLGAEERKSPFWDFAFAEIYWAHLPRLISREAYTLEESASWARSVVGRLRHRYSTGDEEGFRLAATVVEEIAEAIPVLHRLCSVAEKAGIFRFDLAWTLNEYLGDVQIVADYPGERDRIVDRFCQQLDELHGNFDEIHIVAHSEGTVVSFLGLLEALSANSKKPEWLAKVRSYSTFGSPIDKHLVLFPEMWEKYRESAWHPGSEPIRWFNYYDYADPVGFELDITYKWLEENGCAAFRIQRGPGDKNGPNFTHDFGFSRYPLPGKAHVDYFDDDVLFSHVIENAIAPESSSGKPPEKVRDRLLGRISSVLPFILVGLVLLLAVFTFHKSLVPASSYPVIELEDKPEHELRDSQDKVVREFRVPMPGVQKQGGTTLLHVRLAPVSKFETARKRDFEDEAVRSKESTRGIFGVTVLLIGTTAFARVLRLTRDIRTRCRWLIFYAVCLAVFCYFPGRYTLELVYNLGQLCDSLFHTGLIEQLTNLPLRQGDKILTGIFCLLSALVVGVSWGADRWALARNKRPIWGLRIMMIMGALIVLVLVLPRLGDASTSNSSAAVILGAASVFLYLWWIGTLIFDLTFIWHRYINQETDIFHGPKLQRDKPSTVPIFHRYPEKAKDA